MISNNIPFNDIYLSEGGFIKIVDKDIPIKPEKIYNLFLASCKVKDIIFLPKENT